MSSGGGNPWGRARGNVRQTEELRRPGALDGAGDGRGSSRNGKGTSAVSDCSERLANLALVSGDSSGRGGARRDAIVRTKPENVVSKIGNVGEPITLKSNFFELEKRLDWCIYQYRVDFDPDVENLRVRKALISVHRDALSRGFIFDGTMLFMAKKIADCELYSELKQDATKVRITVKMTNEVSPLDERILQVFGLLVRKIMFNLGLKLLGRNYYDAENPISVPEYSLQILAGYVTSIRQFENNVLMSTAISHKIIRQDTVLDAIRRHSESSSRFQEAANEELLGAIVMTTYSQKTYRIDDIDWQKNPLMTFERRKEMVTLKDYYQQQYQIKISDLTQPLLVSKPSKREIRRGNTSLIYLIPELCCMTGLNDEMRNNFRLMRAVADHTRLTPDQRISSLNKFVKQVLGNEKVQEDFTDWGLKFSQRLVEIKGRKLPIEKICIGQNTVSAGPFADWSRDLRSCALDCSAVLNNWIILVPSRMSNDCDTFCQNFRKVIGPFNIKCSKPKIISLPDDRPGTFCQNLARNINPNVDFVVCIVSNNRKDRYDMIKKTCCVEYPVPSQVIVGRTLSKNAMSVCTKIALQINCKMGGELYHVQIPLGDTMLIGYDTYHDSQRKGQSVGGVVCSLNKNFTKYYSSCTFHSNGEELTSQMGQAIAKALRKYKSVNDKYPTRVVVYRDGVGEGQIQYVKDHEVQAIKSVLKETGVEVKFTFIIVTKRINTRLFSQNPRGQGYTNPPPGTICDDVVTHPEWYDFFLVSQSVRQGTVSPTHYNIIEDTGGLTPGQYQMLTYKLTHLYFNWPGTVRVPALCQYAHKLAFLVGQSIHAQPDEKLADKLYFL